MNRREWERMAGDPDRWRQLLERVLKLSADMSPTLLCGGGRLDKVTSKVRLLQIQTVTYDVDPMWYDCLMMCMLLAH